MRKFVQDESGAVTVDWVVLTAVICGLGVGVIATVVPGVVSVGDKVGTAVENSPVGDQ